MVLTRPAAKPTPAQILKGQCWVIDGDTIVIDKVHIRLAGIDAPELDHPYGQKAKWLIQTKTRTSWKLLLGLPLIMHAEGVTGLAARQAFLRSPP